MEELSEIPTEHRLQLVRQMSISTLILKNHHRSDRGEGVTPLTYPWNNANLMMLQSRVPARKEAATPRAMGPAWLTKPEIDSPVVAGVARTAVPAAISSSSSSTGTTEAASASSSSSSPASSTIVSGFCDGPFTRLRKRQAPTTSKRPSSPASRGHRPPTRVPLQEVILFAQVPMALRPWAGQISSGLASPTSSQLLLAAASE